MIGHQGGSTKPRFGVYKPGKKHAIAMLFRHFELLAGLQLPNKTPPLYTVNDTEVGYWLLEV